MELRDYQRLERIVDEYLHKRDWSFIVELYHRIASLEEIMLGWNPIFSLD